MNQQPTRRRTPDFRPAAALVVALFTGGVAGYFAHGALEPQADKPQYETLSYVPRGSQAAFPHTFGKRDEAITWLQRQIAFLDRNATYSQRPVVDRMKMDLAILEKRPTERIERALLEYVREESELLFGYFAKQSPTSAPAPHVPGGVRAIINLDR